MTGAPRGVGVTVTLAKIYDKLLEVERISTVTNVHVENVTADVSDHGNRLNSLERARWPLPSLGVLVALAALAVSFLKN